MEWWQWILEGLLFGVFVIVGAIVIAASFAFMFKAIRDNIRSRRDR